MVSPLLQVIIPIGGEQRHLIMSPVFWPTTLGRRITTIILSVGLLVDVIYCQSSTFHHHVVPGRLAVFDQEIFALGISRLDLVHRIARGGRFQSVCAIVSNHFHPRPSQANLAPCAEVRGVHPTPVESPALGHEIVSAESRSIERLVVQVRQA